MKLFYNARFYSIRKEGESFSAILVDDSGLIKETYQHKPQLANVEEVDLNGSFVYPGFIDTHTHCFEGGLYSLGVNLESAANLQDVFDLLQTAQPLNGRIFAYHLDENILIEKRFPTADELDKLFPDLPVLLRRVDGHSCVINSKAAEIIDWKIPLPSDFNGFLRKQWNGRAANWFHGNLDDAAIIRAYKNAAEIAIKGGHTAVHTMIGDSYRDAKHYELIQDNLAEFPIEYVLYPQITDANKALQLGSKRIGGCVLADGSFGSRSAALLQPYQDEPDNSGVLYRTSGEWEKFIRAAHNNDLQIAIHCIGDAAICQILEIYEKVQQENPKNLRHAIIHCELTSDEMLDRIAAAKCCAIMQPMFDRLWAGPGGMYEQRLGKKRTRSTGRYKSIYERGILLSGGSDWYITDINALKGIDAAVRIHNEMERLTPYQAVDIYTKNAAGLSFDEDRFGTLETGKEANFICLKEDIFTSQNIAEIEVANVFRKGKNIYNN